MSRECFVFICVFFSQDLTQGLVYDKCSAHFYERREECKKEIIPWIRTMIGDRCQALLYMGPWNKLSPPQLQSVTSLQSKELIILHPCLTASSSSHCFVMKSKLLSRVHQSLHIGHNFPFQIPSQDVPKLYSY